MAQEAMVRMDEWVARARSLAPLVERYRDEGEARRRLPQPVMQAAVEQPAKKSFWSLFSKSEPELQMPAPVVITPDQAANGQQSAVPPQAQEPAKAEKQARAAATTAAPQQTATVATAPAPDAVAETPVLTEEPPKKRPFWKIWGN